MDTKVSAIAVCNTCTFPCCAHSISDVDSQNGLSKDIFEWLQSQTENGFTCGENFDVEIFEFKQQLQ